MSCLMPRDSYITGLTNLANLQDIDDFVHLIYCSLWKLAI